MLDTNNSSQLATVESRIVSLEQGLNWEMAPGRSMTYKLMSGQTGDRVSVLEETVPVGAGTPLHIHHTSDELIHIISGELVIRLGTTVTTIGAGAWVFIPRGTTHGWKNVGSVPVQASYTFTPSDGAKVFEESRSLGHYPSENPETMANFQALMKRYSFELVAREWE